MQCNTEEHLNTTLTLTYLFLSTRDVMSTLVGETDVRFSCTSFRNLPQLPFFRGIEQTLSINFDLSKDITGVAFRESHCYVPSSGFGLYVGISLSSMGQLYSFP